MRDCNLYIEKSIEILNKPLSLNDFEVLIKQVVKELSEDFTCEKSVFENLLLLLREKIYTFVAGGELPSSDCIVLWTLFKEKTLEKDENISNFTLFLKKQYDLYMYNQTEKYIFAHLLFLFRMVNGAGEQSLREFLGEHIYFHGQKYHEMDKDAKKLKEFCRICKISFEEVSLGICEALDKYFDVSKEERLGMVTWLFGFFWNTNDYENHPLWRERVYKKVLEIFNGCEDLDLIEEKMSLHFLMSHIYMNRVQTQEESHIFKEEVEKKTNEFYGKRAEKNGLVFKEKAKKNKKQKTF